MVKSSINNGNTVSDLLKISAVSCSQDKSEMLILFDILLMINLYVGHFRDSSKVVSPCLLMLLCLSLGLHAQAERYGHNDSAHRESDDAR